MSNQIELAGTDDVGKLGVSHLKRLWSKSRLRVKNKLPEES